MKSKEEKWKKRKGMEINKEKRRKRHEKKGKGREGNGRKGTKRKACIIKEMKAYES